MLTIRHFKIDRALHRYRRGQGFESHRSLNVFSLSFRNCKSSVCNCGDHPSFNSSLRSSHIWFSHIRNFKQWICYSNVERVNQKNLCLNNQCTGTLILVGDVNVSIDKKMNIETFTQIQTTTASKQYLLAVQTHNFDVVRRIHCSNGSFICKSRTILQ